MAVNLGPSGLTLGSTTINDWDDVGGGKVLQVLSVTKTDTYSIGNSTWGTVLSQAITPSSSSSKILIVCNLMISNTPGGYTTFATLVRDSTDIGRGNASGSRIQCMSADRNTSSGATGSTVCLTYLDSPSTTSSRTYKVQIRSESGGTAYLNFFGSDSDESAYPRGSSTLTVMEIAG